MQTGLVEDGDKIRVRETLAGDAEIDLFEDDRWSGVDLDSSHPSVINCVEPAADLRVVVTKRAKGVPDRFVGAGIQTPDGRLGKLLFIASFLEIKMRFHIEPKLIRETDDLDLHRSHQRQR